MLYFNNDSCQRIQKSGCVYKFELLIFYLWLLYNTHPNTDWQFKHLQSRLGALNNPLDTDTVLTTFRSRNSLMKGLMLLCGGF